MTEPDRAETEPDGPRHPLHQLTTSELARRRRELEHALKYLPETAPVREDLGEDLARVLAEQAEREQIARSGGAERG